MNSCDLLVEYLKTQMRVHARTDKPGEYSLDCPFCETPDRAMHLGLNTEKRLFNCFRCGASGTLEEFLARYNNITTEQAEALLEGVSVPSPTWLAGSLPALQEDVPRPKDYWADELRHGSFSVVGKNLFRYDEVCQYCFERARYYAEYRGFDFDYLVRYYSIRVAERFRLLEPDANGDVLPDFRRHDTWLSIPDFDDKGKVIYMIHRFAGDPPAKMPKYMNVAVPRSKVIWNLWRARSFPDVVLCEGTLSALRVGPNAAAILSKKITEDQINLLATQRIRRFYLFLDRHVAYGGDVTDNDINHNAYMLRRIGQVYIVLCPPHRKDAGEMTREEIDNVLKTAIPFCPDKRQDVLNLELRPTGSRSA